MKRFTFTFMLLLFFITVRAQVPAGFNYQAVVRNSSDELITNQEVSFRISILEGSESGTSVYSETHSAETNDFGLATLRVGDGENKTGTFTPGGWGLSSYFIKIEMDPSGGTVYNYMGTSQLLAVPYAFHAKTVEIDNVEDADADPTNEIQELEIDGNELGLTKSAKTITLPSSNGGIKLMAGEWI